MDSLRCRVTFDAERNVVLQVQGTLSGDVEEPACILRLGDLKGTPQSVRIESVVYAFQDKLGCILHWKSEAGFEEIMPLEGRGQIEFEARQGLHGPKGLEGIYMTTYGYSKTGSRLFLLFDISKQ